MIDQSLGYGEAGGGDGKDCWQISTSSDELSNCNGKVVDLSVEIGSNAVDNGHHGREFGR